MASALLNLVYSIAVVLLAIVGTAFVFFSTSDGTGRETTLSNLSVVVAVALFLAALAATLTV